MRKIEVLAPFVREQTAKDDRATAYICCNYVCQAPVYDAGALVAMLMSKLKGGKEPID